MKAILVAVGVLTIASAAWAEDGWTSYTDTATTAPVGPPPDYVPSPRKDIGLNDNTPPPPGRDGLPGPQGPAGPQGQQGERGEKGDSADLCQNVPGVQTSPGRKYNAQRYWRFLPKWEIRFLAINRKGQIVCVTQRWIRAHGIRSFA